MIHVCMRLSCACHFALLEEKKSYLPTAVGIVSHVMVPAAEQMLK